MEKITGFGKKNSLTLPSLAISYFNSSRIESDGQFYTYNDKCLRWFVRRVIIGGRCIAFNQNYKSEISDKVFDIISSQKNVKRKICEIVEKNLNLWINTEK